MHSQFDYDEMVNKSRMRRSAHEAYVQKCARRRGTRSSLLAGGGSLLLVLLAALLLLTGTGCALSAEAAALQTARRGAADSKPAANGLATMLVGTFQVYDNAYPSFIQFNADGTFRRASMERKLADEPVDQGRWHMEEDVLVLVSDAAVVNCKDGQTGRYAISLYENGGYHFLRLTDACSGRAEGFVPGPDFHPLQNQGLFCRSGGSAICDR